MPGNWPDPKDRLIGSLVGAYRLVRRLGEGGMGAVYLAEREEDFSRVVAVKLLLQGAAGGEVAHRFQAEKETLASFNHPNIVRLLDAGISGAGIPYLAMEYVEGLALDDYCATHQSDLRDRLQLVIQILEALEFAHQRLVVHCDLKPANVIVTPEGCARLLDFGIAKLLNPAHYGFGDPLTKTFRPLTPEFASPEQLGGQPLTTATDLYSTGVLLYSLLAGEHPFEHVIMQPVSLLEAICFEPPEPPSRRAARNPGGPVEARRIEGDLDAIVLKALRKEPEQRYPSAALFAADLRRFLEGMPVEARQGSWRYRAAKYARRNRGAAAAIAMAVLAVGVGAAGTLWERVRAERARTRAELRFNEVRKLSNTLLADFYDNVGKLPGATGVQQMLVVRSVRYLDSLAAESQSNPSLELELADGYVKLAGLQGSPYENNIGKPDEGLATIAKAVTTSSRLANDVARDHQAFLVLSKARQMRGDILLGIGRIQEALEESRLAAGIMDRLATQRPTDAGILVQAASCHEAVGDQLGSAGLTSMLDRGAAKREFEQALDLYRRANLVDGALPRPRRALVVIRMKLADVGWDLDPAASLAGYQEAYRALQQLPPRELEELPNRRLRASLLRRLGESFSEFGRHDDALKILEEDVQVLDSMLSIDPANERAQWDLTIAVNAQGNAESARGRPGAALPHYERVLTLLEKMPNLERSVQLELSHGETLAAIGGILNSTGDHAGAAAKTGQGLAILRRLGARKQGSTQALVRIADAFLTSNPAELQDPRFALACLEKAGEQGSASGANPSMLFLKAQAERRLGRNSQALATAETALAQLAPANPGQPSTGMRQRIEKFLGR